VSEILYEAEDATGRTLQVVPEDDGTLSISIFAPGQDNTDWTMAFDDEYVGEIQLALAAYLHQKK
jgi:hypothetical protein